MAGSKENKSSDPRNSQFSGKVFGIGLPKTATTSLEEAFENVGLSKLGFSRKGLAIFLEHGMCSQLRDIIEHYDAFADWPWCLCYRELLNEYGSNAKFILTRRQSPEVWLKSVLSSSLFANMAEVRRQVYGFEMPHGHEAFLLEHYNRHIECVHTFFDQQGASDQLIDIVVGETGSWQKFCEFLDVKNNMGGFPKKNITAERTYNPKTLYSNFILLNNAQLGLGRPALTFPEACQAVKWPNGRDPRASQKLREYACLGSQAYQEHQKVKKKQPKIQRIKSKILRSVEGCFGEESNSKTDNLDVFERYVRDFMQEVEEKNLFGVANKPEPNLSSGYEVFGREISTILAQASRKFVKNQGVLPNLLFPQTFSEFNILCKAFYRFPVGPLEDKLRAIELVPDDARKLLSKHFRPFVIDAAGAPINAQIPPGAYLWKANFGYSLYEMVSFPATKERCLELEALAGEWFKSSTNIATGQWWTRHVQRKVFLEERLGTSDEEPRDWKFFVFGGRVGLVQVDSGRHSDHHQSAFDREFNRLNVEIYATDGPDIQRPERYEEMLYIAETIGSRFDFIRVDLYFEGGKIYLGELTPVPHAGFKPFRTQSLDFKLGKMWPKDSVLRNDLDWYYRSSRDRSQC